MSLPVATPIDRYLSAQADMRAVDRFARTDVAGRTGQWTDLIPLSSPRPGEHYRFEVDLDACTGCKACVTACHSLNGLDEAESFRSIGLLIDPTAEGTGPVEQTITTACHHCVEPGCLIGCPAEAYEKDPVTGIVRHLDDACIGCQYCTLTCPYDVPVYNDRLGIVRKCDLCADRLAEGEAPACVQGCPTQAISVSVVELSAHAQPQGNGGSGERMIPGAALSKHTLPTTLYRGRALESAVAAAQSQQSDGPADAKLPVVQHAHPPLVAMLVISQWAVGVAAASVLLDRGPVSWWNGGHLTISMAVAATLGLSSALASLAHLGQPLKAWRAVLGWRHSWLSREVVALSAAIGTATVAAVATGLSELDRVAPLSLSNSVSGAAAVLAVGSGAATVSCSAMIYIATGRRWWRPAITATRFATTVGMALVAWLAMVSSVASPEVDGHGWWVTAVAFGTAALVVAAQIRLWPELVWGRVNGTALTDDDRRVASLLRGPLQRSVRIRLALLGLGAVLIVTALTGSGPVAWLAAIAGSGLWGAAELIDRRLFFQACAPQTMPGAHR